MLKKTLIFILALTALVTANSCGSNDHYTVEGTIQGLGTRNLRFYYYDENGLKVGVMSALDGKFTFSGSAKKQTLLSIATNQRGIITTIAVKNGDYVKLSYTLNEPWTLRADGNSINSALTSFAQDNADALRTGNPAVINAAVEKYVSSNAGNDAAPVIAALFYDNGADPDGANRLIESIPQEKRDSELVSGYLLSVARQTQEQRAQNIAPIVLYTTGDSLMTFSPGKYTDGTLVTLTDNSKVWKDSLNRLMASLPEKVQVLNINLEGDTAAWMTSLRDNPSQRGINTWIPGSVASPRLVMLAPINSLPEFVAVDNTGRRLYQGPSLSAAINTLK